MSQAKLLTALFARFGVAISEAETSAHADNAPREVIIHLLANREIAARFDAAHGRPPNDDDVEELLDIYTALAAKEAG